MKLVEKKGEFYYMVDQPTFTEDEELLTAMVSSLLVKESSIEEVEQIFLSDKKKGSLLHKIEKDLIKKMGTGEVVTDESVLKDKREDVLKFIEKEFKKAKHTEELATYVTNLIFGMGQLTPLMEDPELEEVMVNGVDKPVRVFHRKKGMCKTNLSFNSKEELLALLERIAGSGGKEVNPSNPLVDSRLGEGLRVNMTVPPASTSPTLTVRKFSVMPYSVLDLIKYGTLNYDLAAFLWLAVEGFSVSPMNLIVVGGSGSGKTTTLNALSSFIPLNDRILTIEDTLELGLGKRDNWIQLETAYDYKTKTQITMNDLIRASLRMRPDRIIVGEVRGEEATSLFTAMDIGITGSMGTLHSNDARETLLRLQSPPMNVPKTLVALLDLIIIQHRFKLETGVVRRITQVSEVSWMGDKVLLNDIYKWDKEQDEISRTNLPSQTIEKLAFSCGKTKESIMRELELRKRLLIWFKDKNKESYEDVMHLTNEFYSDRLGFLNKVTAS
jgi:flagellar protein FlaI